MTASAKNLTLGDAIDARLGRPFEWLARGPEAFDCLGLYLDLLEDVQGVRLPHPFRDRASAEEGLLGFWKAFDRLPTISSDLEPMDILFWRLPGHRGHVVIVEDPAPWGWCASVSEERGVHRLPIRTALDLAEDRFHYRGPP